MTESRGILGAGGSEGYHARLRAGSGQLNLQRTPSTKFVDDWHRRAAARSLRQFAPLDALAAHEADVDAIARLLLRAFPGRIYWVRAAPAMLPPIES